MRNFWRRSDRARFDYSNGVDAGANKILPKHEREPQDRYARRLQQAMVRRFARPIIDRYNDFVCRDPVHRQKPSQGSPYGVVLLDADGQGTPLAAVMRRALRKSQVDGITYLLSDSSDPNTYASAGQEIAAGKRGVIRTIDADQVVWWKYWSGNLVEALITFEDRAGNPFAWYVTEDAVQRIDLKAGSDASTALVVTNVGPATAHGYGGCPLVPLTPIFDDDCAVGDDSQCAPLAEGQKRVCNLDSWLLEELQSSTFTTTVFLGVSADQVKDVAVGPGQALCLPSQATTNPSIGKIGSDVTQAASIRESLDYEIRELYRVAGLSPGNPTEAAQPESGVAKAFAFNEIEAKCSALADAAELAENTVILRLSAGHGFAYPGDCDWPDEFATPDMSEELELLIRMQSASLPPTLERAQVTRFAEVAFRLTEKQQADFAAELDAQQEFSAKQQQSQIVNPPGGKAGT